MNACEVVPWAWFWAGVVATLVVGAVILVFALRSVPDDPEHW